MEIFKNRLFKSSKFWNAVIASIFGVVSFMLTNNELVTISVFSLFGLKQFTDGAEDFIKARKGIRYNKENDTEEYIPANE